MLNISLKQFKINHKKKINQILYLSLDSDGSKEIINLINNFFTEKNAFVFESVEKGFIKGRYTIFGKNPDKIWEFNNNVSKIYFDNKVKILKGTAKKNIENVIESFKFKIPRELPSISSIISGYFSYDIIRYLENIPNKNRDDLKLPDARIIRPRELIIHDNIKKKLYFIINVFCDEKINNYKIRYEKIINQIENLIFLSNYNNSYKDKINKKVKPFMYFFNFKDFQIIGASPEILVRLRNNKVTIRPIAGTRPRGKNKKQDLFFEKDLLNDKKELSEHLMLLDLGRNDTGKVSKINTVKVTESFSIERYSHVMHIVSNVEGVFNNKYSKFETMLSGFPAGTVSGAPKIRAMEIIDELETTKRKVYAGGIGYFSANGEFDTCIALRTAVAKNKKFYVQSGAGIVADSKPQNEYLETVNKAKALLKAIE